MNREEIIAKGQCPNCFKVHEFGKGPATPIVRCDCGKTLFATHADQLNEVPVHCTQCKESYIVDPEDIGEWVECECGAELEVYSIVLRQSIKNSRAIPIEAIESEASAHEVEVASTHKPTLEEDAHQQNTHFIDTETNSDDDEPQRKKASPKQQQHKVAWLPIIGGSLAGLFFIFSVGMFIYSRLNDHESSNSNGKERKPATRHDSSKTTPSFASQPIDPAEIKKLLKKLPIPQQREIALTSSKQSPSDADNDSGEPSQQETPTAQAKNRSPYGSPTAPRQFVLPKATKPLERIDEVPVARPRLLLASAYQDAFESYEKLNKLEDKEKKELSDGYKNQLGETLYLTRHAFQIANESGDTEKRNELVYLLAYLSFTANRFPEAAIYGEVAAKWGDSESEATHEAAMIALASCQGANASHWGSAEQVGELNQMKAIANLIDERWPDDPQRDVIWMSLGQSYFAFGQPLMATKAFQRIDKESKEYEAAQLGSGQAYWTHFIDLASTESPDAEKLVGLLESTKKHLGNAVESMQKGDAKPTSTLLSVKLILAKVTDRLGDSKLALQWLEGNPYPVTKTMKTGESKDASKVSVDASFMRSVFDLVYRLKTELHDWEGARQALQSLENAASENGDSNFSVRHLALAKGLIGELIQADRITVTQVDELKTLLDEVQSSSKQHADSMQLWIAKTWTDFGENAENQEVAANCYEMAQQAYERALKQPDLTKELTQSVQLRLAELAQKRGDSSTSLKTLTEILKQAPNAISLQMQAAHALEQKAFEQESVAGLLDAINGPRKENGQGDSSPLWGWVKLTNTLHQLRYSEKGTERHKQQYREAQFYLARCQWILANVTRDSSRKETQLKKLKTQITRILAVSGEEDAENSVWIGGLEQLLKLLE